MLVLKIDLTHIKGVSLTSHQKIITMEKGYELDEGVVKSMIAAYYEEVKDHPWFENIVRVTERRRCVTAKPFGDATTIISHVGRPTVAAVTAAYMQDTLGGWLDDITPNVFIHRGLILIDANLIKGG